jgi:hypothetical protein
LVIRLISRLRRPFGGHRPQPGNNPPPSPGQPASPKFFEDFRKLAARHDIHPGLIILPSVGKAQSIRFRTDTLTTRSLAPQPKKGR